jgi:hypothetical protein
LNLPRPGNSYDQANEADTRRQISESDTQNMKKSADVSIVRRRLILQSPNGSLWSVVVSNAGALSATAI